MNIVNIKLVDGSLILPTIKVDNKRVQFKKNKYGSNEVGYQTDKDIINIKITKLYEASSKLWWLTNILFFIISIFGIFDMRYSKACKSIKYEANIEIKNISDIKLTLQPFKVDSEAIVLEGTNNVKTIENIYYVDELAQKRLKKSKSIKLSIWGILVLASIITIILVIVL